MNGLYFYSHCVGFLFNKKKMSDYYGEYLFSSLYVAFLISKYQKLSDEFMFSSPHGAYLISIKEGRFIKNTLNRFSSPPGAYLISITYQFRSDSDVYVFVPSRGISNLNKWQLFEYAKNGNVFVPSRGISNLNDAVEKLTGFKECTFSSPPGAYLISINSEEYLEVKKLFSSPPGAFLISIPSKFMNEMADNSFRPLPGHS